MLICSLINSFAKKMQMSAMKACFQIAECSFSSTKILKKFQLCKKIKDYYDFWRLFK